MDISVSYGLLLCDVNDRYKYIARGRGFPGLVVLMIDALACLILSIDRLFG